MSGLSDTKGGGKAATALCAVVLATAARLFAAALTLHEVPASTNAPFHLELANDAVDIAVFPGEGGRVEGCTNLNAVLPMVSTNASVAWRWTRSKTGTRTLWLGGADAATNGVSRTLGLTLERGLSPLAVELILANGTDAAADVAWPVAVRLQPFERRRFCGTLNPAAQLALAADTADKPMGESMGRARARAVSLGCGALTNGEFKVALDYFERAIGYGSSSAALHVCKAYCLRRLSQNEPRLRARASKELRMAAKSEPLDTWNLVERAFLEDDGEGAAEGVARFGGDASRQLGQILEGCRRLGAKHEIGELERQMRAAPSAR